MESCLYEGIVHHERLTPVNHSFQYGLYIAYLDLDELPSLIRWGTLSDSRFAPASFVRGDHVGDSRITLAQSVREIVARETGATIDGPIRVLTQLRCFGYYFSPLNLCYCFASDGTALQTIVAVVQNTPWLERHCYVLWSGNRDASGVAGAYRHRKAFHVSPFLGMDIEYRWRINQPDEQLGVAIENARGSSVLFRAGMQLRRRPLTRHGLRQMQGRYPFMTSRITAAIYYQAFQLWRKKCPFYPHPEPLPSTVPPAEPNQSGSPVSSIVSAETGWQDACVG